MFYMQDVDQEYYEKLAKNFSVLYVRDKEVVQGLDKTFKKVYEAHTQEEAIALYEQRDIDIIFIDVDTQNLSWLFLVKELRKKAYDLPIALLTDVSNTDRLTTAITVGITQCIFKPIDAKRLKLVIYDIVNKLQNKLDAKELFYKKEQEKINGIASQTAENIIQDIPLPMFIFKDNEVLFANKCLYRLFEDKKVFEADSNFKSDFPTI